MNTDKNKPALKALVTVKFFGPLATVAGQNEKSVECDGTLEALLHELHQQHPLLTQHRFTVAVNRTITTGHHPLYTGDEVALLPPFSGG